MCNSFMTRDIIYGIRLYLCNNSLLGRKNKCCSKVVVVIPLYNNFYNMDYIFEFMN